MIRKTITYTDYNEIERTENFDFHLTEAEISEMELSTPGGWHNWAEKVVAAQDLPSLVKLFKDLILCSYGEKSDDGRRFVKSKEISTEFMQTGAYVKLYMELSTNAKAASEFFNGVMPAQKKDSNNQTPAPMTLVQ